MQVRCKSCGAELSPSESACTTCGAPQGDTVWEECEIGYWRGYVSGEFIALSVAGPRTGEAVRSKRFRWLSGNAAPRERGRAVARLAELAKRLESEGWHRFDRGEDWYALRFWRVGGTQAKRHWPKVSFQTGAGGGRTTVHFEAC